MKPMNGRPTLSICIPTYNQPGSIEAFFKSVTPQLSNEIEILIRDDSSNGETYAVVQECIKTISVPIRYFKGEKAKVGGYDQALLFLTERANGDWLWWYGDDVMAPDAIQRVLTAIHSRPNLSFIWLNSRDINDLSDPGMNLGGDKYFRNGSEVFETNVGLLGFPTATLLKRGEAMTGFDAAREFIGTTLTGFYLVLQVLSQKDKEFLFLQNPCLLSNPKPPGEARWYDSFQVHGINYFVIAREFKDKFQRASLRKGLADQYGRIWRAVVVERAMGLETGFATRTPKIWKMARLYWTYPEFYIALPLMLVPRPVLRMFYALYKWLGRARRQVPI